MTRPPATPEELDALAERISAWLAGELETNPILLDVTRDDELPYRWFVRLAGEEKDFTTIWMTLGQRTLKYETYVLPAPEQNRAPLFELLLRRNYGLVGAHFAIGPEDAVFLSGELPVHVVDEEELDRIVGSLLEYVEQVFRRAVEHYRPGRDG
jgi:Putative bacterial sensory transduction regulator